MSNTDVRFTLDDETRSRIERAAAEAGHTTASYLAELAANAADGVYGLPSPRSLNAAYWHSVRHA
ncbi:hypothetical protein [Actinosynnema sp. NPDC020468]|uniref:hypothetical protein n=1 Tax=Actinosynnema sp. NPDC020468 TaxID=3154488 RepID=UPI0033FE7069